MCRRSQERNRTKAPDGWGPYKFLVCAWSAEGHCEPGQGKGGFSFWFELQGKILVRRNHLEFPATPQRPAFTHEDLLVVYRDADTTPNRAIYFDSEGFVILNSAAFSEEGKVLTFLSDAGPQASSQRSTYVQNGESGTPQAKFELAPPSKPGAFVTHVEGVAHREKEALISSDSERLHRRPLGKHDRETRSADLEASATLCSFRVRLGAVVGRPANG